jgi:hypothetical protein
MSVVHKERAYVTEVHQRSVEIFTVNGWRKDLINLRSTSNSGIFFWKFEYFLNRRRSTFMKYSDVFPSAAKSGRSTEVTLFFYKTLEKANKSLRFRLDKRDVRIIYCILPLYLLLSESRQV